MAESKKFDVKQLLLLAFVLGLVAMAWQIVSPFLVPVVWAIILAFSSWPLYLKLLKLCKQRTNLAALIMTLAMAFALILPMFWLFFTLKAELTLAANVMADKFEHGTITLPEFIKNLPIIGSNISAWMEKISTQPHLFKAELQAVLGHADQFAFGVLGGIGRNLAKMGFALLTLFFVYRDGTKFLGELISVSQYMLGERVRTYIQTAGDATRGAVYGVVITALVQGFVAGLGYWAVGLGSPMMLALITVLFALIPFGTPLVWLSLSAWLLLTGEALAGVGLLIWCAIAVSWVDNVIRPIVVSQNVELPFILAFFGVLGGLAAFGLVGLFLGPVILAVAYAVWKEWLAASPAGHGLLEVEPNPEKNQDSIK